MTSFYGPNDGQELRQARISRSEVRFGALQPFAEDDQRIAVGVEVFDQRSLLVAVLAIEPAGRLVRRHRGRLDQEDAAIVLAHVLFDELQKLAADAASVN